MPMPLNFTGIGFIRGPDGSAPWFRTCCGVLRDIACTALYLASDESTFCNGSELVVDGGFYAM